MGAEIVCEVAGNVVKEVELGRSASRGDRRRLGGKVEVSENGGDGLGVGETSDDFPLAAAGAVEQIMAESSLHQGSPMDTRLTGGPRWWIGIVLANGHGKVTRMLAGLVLGGGMRNQREHVIATGGAWREATVEADEILTAWGHDRGKCDFSQSWTHVAS